MLPDQIVALRGKPAYLALGLAVASAAILLLLARLWGGLPWLLAASLSLAHSVVLAWLLFWGFRRREGGMLASADRKVSLPEEALREPFRDSVGEELFDEICAHVAEKLRVDYAFVGKISRDRGRVDALSAHGFRERQEPFSYQLEGTPCSDVARGSVCAYRDGARRLFPRDPLLQEMDIEGYVGTPLFSRKGEVLGIMVLLNRKPIEDVETAKTLVSVFSERISSELERIESEEALRVSEGWLRFALSASGVGIWSWDPNTNEVEWSDQVERIFGLEPGDFGRTYEAYAKRVYPPDMPLVEGKIEKALSGGEEYDVQHRIVMPDGSLRWIRGRGRVVRDDHGRATRMTGTVADITDMKQAQDALAHSEKRYRNLFEKSNDGILILDEDGRIRDLNDAACSIFGYRKDEACCLRMLDLLPEGEREAASRMFDSVLREGARMFELKCSTRSRKTFHAEVSASLLELGGRRMVQAVYRDVTARKVAEAKLLEAKERAEESDRLKSAFLANMSHEIRTPLNGIMGIAQLLGFGDVSEGEMKRYLDIIRSSGEHLLRLINDLLDIAQLEAGQLKLHPEVFDLDGLMQDVFSAFEMDLRARKGDRVVLRYDNEGEGEYFIHSDETRLRQVLDNLLANAAKFTKEGSIHFGYTKMEGHLVQIYVEDTGRGVAEDKLERIFERFNQADVELTREFEGAGLGLSICKGLAELMGGGIEIKSEEGVGTRVAFTFPCCESEDAKEGRAPLAGASDLGPREKIDASVLVVEDDDMNYLLLEHMLNDFGIATIRASNGGEAVEQCARRDDLSLVLMDIRMPQMNGYEATKLIKSQRPGLPIIAQTAFAMQSDRQRAKQAGCDDYISKPIQATELYRLIDEYLSRRHN